MDMTKRNMTAQTIWLGNCSMNIESFPVEILTKKEKETYESLRFPKLKDFYLHVHASVRISISRETGIDEKEIKIEQLSCPCCGSANHGPPVLNLSGQQKKFSLSKSYPFYAFCISDHLFGIDIERKTEQSMDIINDTVFSSLEMEKLALCRDKGIALRWWVRKESVLKAKGIGLAKKPSTVDVSRVVKNNLSLVVIDDEKWHVKDLARKSDEFELAIAYPAQYGNIDVRIIQAY